MNYAIIRNTKYTRNQLNIVYRHNERKNTNYSNKDINKSKSNQNYSIKQCNMPYEKKFNEIRKEYNLKGKIKNISNIACEYIITASPEFFQNLDYTELKRYFNTAYKFVCKYKDLGEQYILSAKVHLDESTPHLHLIYLPIIHTIDKKTGEKIDKLCCSDFWKGKNSYKILQDKFYNYMTKAGFTLARGNNDDNKHIKIEDLKRITNYEIQKYEKETNQIEIEINTNDTKLLIQENKRIIKKFNTLANQYTKIKNINDSNITKYMETKEENKKLQFENHNLKITINNLKSYINKTFECMSILFDFSAEKMKKIVNNFIKESDKNVK